MARIKIEQLPVMEDMDEKELKGSFGGLLMPGVGRLSKIGGRFARLGGFGRRGNIVGENNPWAKAGENNPWANVGGATV